MEQVGILERMDIMEQPEVLEQKALLLHYYPSDRGFGAKPAGGGLAGWGESWRLPGRCRATLQPNTFLETLAPAQVTDATPKSGAPGSNDIRTLRSLV